MCHTLRRAFFLHRNAVNLPMSSSACIRCTLCRKTSILAIECVPQMLWLLNWSLWSIAWTLNPLCIAQLHTTNCRLIWAILLPDQTHQQEANFWRVVAFRTTHVWSEHKNETVTCFLIFSFYPLPLLSLPLPHPSAYCTYSTSRFLLLILFASSFTSFPFILVSSPFPYFPPFFPYQSSLLLHKTRGRKRTVTTTTNGKLVAVLIN
jgi:hypothetical protein